ncbi:prepilin-type N-terminal cleavage/methylation domain-containing protein [Pseudomonas aeruginosa]
MRSKRSSGFISIELMIALVVIAIATAAAYRS